VERDIVYRPGSSHPKHRLDLYPAAAKGAPIAIFVHGGYWISGDRRAPEHGPGLYQSVGEALARRGVTTIIPSYRLAPEVGIAAMHDDVVRAIAWVRGRADLGDRDRLALVGHSAGGHLAALAACRPRSGVAAVGVLSGIWDVADMRAKQPPSFNRAVTMPVFGSGRDAAWSPLSHLDHAPARWLVAIAEHDFGYMIPQAEAADRALRARSRSARLLRAEGYDHLDMVRRLGTEDDRIGDAIAALLLPKPGTGTATGRT